MGEQLISASGIQHGMIVNSDGSINISGTVTASVTAGSTSFNFVQSGNGVWIEEPQFRPVVVSGTVPISGNVLVSGTILSTQGTNPWITLGSFAVTNIGSVIQFTNPWIVLGSTQITNPSAVGSLSLYKTSLYGSSGTDAGIYPLNVVSGTNGTLLVAQSTTPWSISGNVLVSGTVFNNPLGVGSIYGIGVGSVAVAVISPATIGSLAVQTISGNVLVSGTIAVTQSTTPWAISGNVLISGTVINVGSVAITNSPNIGSILNPISIKDIGSPCFTIATATASGTYTQVWTLNGAGSRVEIHGFHISTNAPGIVRLATSGSTPSIFSTFYLNFQSGATIEKTFVMPIIPNGAGSPIGFQTTVAGSTSVTIYGREVA